MRLHVRSDMFLLILCPSSVLVLSTGPAVEVLQANESQSPCPSTHSVIESHRLPIDSIVAHLPQLFTKSVPENASMSKRSDNVEYTCECSCSNSEAPSYVA